MKKLLFILGLSSFLWSVTLDFYCGSTMAKAMRVIADKFEAKTGVHINIIKGGSGKLYKKILLSKKGDLYFPESYLFIKEDDKGLFGFQRLIGYNKAVILVPKGNPANVKSLDDFTKLRVRVVLGNSKAGSVGKISKKILTDYKGDAFFAKVYLKAIKVPTSLEIIQALKQGKADASINWKAAAFMDDNENYVDFIHIPFIAPKQKLILTVVNYSKYPNIAEQFVRFAASGPNKKFMKSKGF